MTPAPPDTSIPTLGPCSFPSPLLRIGGVDEPFKTDAADGSAMTGKTGMLWCGSFVHLPLELVIDGRSRIDPTQELWQCVLESTWLPAVMP